ncbi:MAG: uroporphyrinogen decarboxylase [Acidimicrobiales bacterium]
MPRSAGRAVDPQTTARADSASTGSARTGSVGADSASSGSDFLRACRCQPVERTPVWFMRQAGRSLPEYRALRGSGSILDAVGIPELAAELTMQPVLRYGVDAAILYSDIMVPLAAIGFGVDIVPGVGPVVERPFRTESDLARIRPLDPQADTPYVTEAIKMLVSELKVPLIGFAGAPFTLASYLIEGGPSRTYGATKAFMHGEPALWARLVDALAELSLASLRSQVAAGVAAVQLFDSWAGTLSERDYRALVAPASAKVLAGLEETGVPRIHFGVGTGELLGAMAEVGAEVVGVDWRVSLVAAAPRAGPGRALQGNLDPAVCLAPWEVVATQVRRVLDDAAGLPGHVFNLGHGVLPETDPATLARIVEMVHEAGGDRR